MEKDNVMTPDMDRTPRYAPSTVIYNMRRQPVIGAVFHPAGAHPKGCMIVPEMGALELKTPEGSRWYGCESAYINSELRMVVIGTPVRDEVRMAWQPCTTR